MNAAGQRPVAVESTANYTTLFAYDGSGNLEYMGTAVIGTATNAAAWQIKKFGYSSGNLVSIKFADGEETFDNVWDNRASLSYS